MQQSRARMVGYWISTLLVCGEMALGGAWDILQLPFVKDIVIHLGYPSYFLIILGVWKILGAVALLMPGSSRIKEWAYAGAMINYTSAVASRLIVGDGFNAIVSPALQIIFVIASWMLRPPSRRVLTS